MLERGAKFLELVYESPRWRIWEVRGTDPPASGGAKLLAAGPNWFMVNAAKPTRRPLPLHAVLVDQRRVREPRAGRLDAGRAARRRASCSCRRASGSSAAAAPRAVSRRGVPVRFTTSLRGNVVSRCSPAAPGTCCGRSCCSAAPTGSTGSCAGRSSTSRRRRSSTRARSSTPSRRCTCSSSRAAALGDRSRLGRRRRLLDVPEHALRRDDVHARVHLPVPQRALLLGAQHVHGRDGAGARRLRRSIRPRRRGCCPSSGFADSVSDFTGVSSDASVNALFNPYAAVPSMHVGFALMLASR